MPAAQPILIHSLFRASSTYFFQKFRSLGAHFTCYQEPFNETLLALNRRSEQRQERKLLGERDWVALRHPPLEKPYFYEFWLRRSALQGLFHESFAYRNYFVPGGTALPPAQHAYIATLLEQARGRAVLQFCRSAGRAAALRSAFGGTHIHLWREPRAQWWSYKIADYFDRVSRRIYRADHLPNSLRELAATSGVLDDEQVPLTPHSNYLMFYGLWLDAWLRLEAQSDLSIQIDALCLQPETRRSYERQLSGIAGRGVDLSDARASGMVFTHQEESFYGEVEARVHEVFVRSRDATASAIDAAAQGAQQARDLHAARPHDAAAERNLRHASLQLMERAAIGQRRGRPLRSSVLGWLARHRPALISSVRSTDFRAEKLGPVE